MTLEEARQEMPALAAAVLVADSPERSAFVGALTGCDVYGYLEAVFPRRCQRAGLVRVTRAKDAPKDGAAQQPYFGCVATAKGRQFAAMVLGVA